MTEDPILAGLDPQQRAAATHVDGPGLIVAGAGAGKTTVLVRRTAHLVRTGIDPSRILLLTFTRASAASILDRARAFSPDVRDVVGGTFHSVAARVIRENHHVFGLPEGFTVMDPDDVDDTLKRLMADSPSHLALPRSSTVAKIISFARNTQRTVQETLMLPQNWKHRDLITWFVGIADRYLEYKKRLGILDFDDLLEFWARMAEHDALGAMLGDRFSYVMVDEHQDSNALQLRIIYGLGGSQGNVMAVGDPSQSIYGFRGAAPGTMFDFRRQWPATKTFLIETNYRSTPEIVALADRVDRSMLQRFERNLVAAKPSNGMRPSIVHVPDADSEADWIVDRILANRDEGMAFEKQAVLVRSSRRARHVEAKLAAAGIPYKFFGGIKLHEAAHIKDLISVLRVAINPSDEPAWLRFLPILPRIGIKTAAGISADLVDSVDAAEVIRRLSGMALKRKELAVAIPVIRAVIAASSALAALEGARRELGPFLADRWGDEWEWRKKDIDDVVDLAATQGTTENFLRMITIDVAIDKKSETKRSAMQDERPMSVCTVHAAKGLEWDAVFVPSFVSGHMPSQFAEPGEGDEEEKRLFYVAVTRARKDLRLLKPSSAIVQGSPVLVGESAFQPLIANLVDKEHATTSRAPATLALPTKVVIDGWA